MEVSNDSSVGRDQNNDETDVKFQLPRQEDINHIPSFAFLPVEALADDYNMNHARRGRAIIFNHENYLPHLGNPIRTGTTIDRDNLYLRLRELEFDVTCYNDLTFNEIKFVIAKLASEDHKENDCLLIAVLTHGADGAIYAKDQPYKQENLWSHFTSDLCPTLAGKPKLFFIQACQGDQRDKGTYLLPHVMIDSPSSVAYKIPTHADFLIAHSTLPGFLSFRNSAYGSVFIGALCCVLSERGKVEDLLSLMTIVLRKIATHFESNTPDNPTTHQLKQMPCLTSLLTRKIYFKPKTRRV